MNTWVVVADAARARFLAVRDNQGAYLGSEAHPASRPAPRGELEEIVSLSNPAARMSDSDLETDRPGSTSDRKGDAMHAYEPPNSVRDVEAKRFAREVVDELDQALQAGRVERFYLMAAPDFLGLLRDQMGKALQAALVADQAKDVSSQSPEDIRAALPARL
ncbi:MAG: host attachment protein [Guyparkeria sp.]|uniref:host attachment protein n=1 Tax=Guyparkeria sp. TaxID=2035736 RepID=UPI00397BE4AA